MRRKLMSMVLALAMVFSLVVVPATAEEPAGNWYDAAMSTWAQRGVLQGDAAGNLNPTADITRAELTVMLDRIMGYKVKASNTFADVQSGAWYADAVLKASAAGILQGDGTNARPTATITRQEAMVMLARVLNLSGEAGATAGYTDAGQIASWAQDGVKSMAAMGYVQGSDGQIRPTANITRAEVATILSNIFQGYYDQAGTYTKDVNGTAVISADNVTLSNLNVSGDLIIAEGVGDGHVVLDGVTLGGRLLVRGGGANSIIISGSSKIGTVVVARQDGKVRVAVQGGADVSVVYVDDGADTVKIEGNVDTVTVAAAEASIEIAGTVAKVELTSAADNAALTVDKGAKVETLTNAAPNTEVSVAGAVTTVNTTASATGAALSVEKGATVTTVTAAAANSSVSVAGTVSKVEMAGSAAGAALTVSSGAKVSTVTTAADNVSVSGSGTISNMTVTGGTGVSVSKDTTVTKVENKGDSTVTVGDKEVSGGDSGSSSGSGSTGGGGGGGGGSTTTYYAVDFYDGTSKFASQSIASGGKAANPGNPPAVAYYTFKFWGFPAAGSAAATAYDFNTAVTQSKSIYAIREPVVYNINYTLNGGTNSTQNPATYTIESSTITLTAPTKAGNTFGGWYSDAGFNTQVTAIATGSHGNLVLYAKWTPDSPAMFTVTFDLNSATGTAPAAQTVANGGTATAPATTPTWDGHTFKFWSTSASGTEYVFTTPVTGDITLYAIWEETDFASGTGTQNDPYIIRTTVQLNKVSSYTSSTYFAIASDVDSNGNITINENSYLTINERVTLTIGANDTLTNLGTLTVNGVLQNKGILVNNGTLTKDNGKVAVSFYDGAYLYRVAAISSNGTVSKPANPAAKSAYTFQHWSASRDDSSNDYNFSTKINADTSIYAIRKTVDGTALFTGAGNNNNPYIINDAIDLAAIAPNAKSGEVYQLASNAKIAVNFDITIPTGVTLVIPNGATLIIDKGVTVTNSGTITNNGTITKYGTISGTISGTQPAPQTNLLMNAALSVALGFLGW